MALKQGSIVWVEVADTAGRNPKCRPAVVVTPTNEISEEDTFVVVAATSSISDALPENIVELPWHADRHPKTGLYKQRVAVCDWLIEISHVQVQSTAGTVPQNVLQQILDSLPPE